MFRKAKVQSRYYDSGKGKPRDYEKTVKQVKLLRIKISQRIKNISKNKND
jgi:hypothetical protein